MAIVALMRAGTVAMGCGDGSGRAGGRPFRGRRAGGVLWAAGGTLEIEVMLHRLVARLKVRVHPNRIGGAV